jgi:hypothetical protein
MTDLVLNTQNPNKILEDICTFRRDQAELKQKEKENKNKKEIVDIVP